MGVYKGLFSQRSTPSDDRQLPVPSPLGHRVPKPPTVFAQMAQAEIQNRLDEPPSIQEQQGGVVSSVPFFLHTA
jgi:hypothetical protein